MPEVSFFPGRHANRSFRFFFLAILAILLLSPNAQAIGGDYSNPTYAASTCYGTVTSSSFIEPLVRCFTEVGAGGVPIGIIPLVTADFLTRIQADYIPTVSILFVLAIALYGLRITTGSMRRLKSETFILGLKMAGIVLYLNQAGNFYIDMLGIMQGLSETISGVATSLHTDGFCVSATTVSSGAATAWQQGMWQRWDCIFQYILGLSAGGLAVAGIASFLLLFAYSMGTGVLVFFIGLYFIMALLSAAFRFVHVYLMAMLSLSFVFCFGYLFVPLLLFRQTHEYFRKWLTAVLGFVLTPVLMFGFMGMMLVALDITIFSGPFSLFCAIGGPNYCGGSTHAANGKDMFKHIIGVVDPNHNTNVQQSFFMITSLGLNGVFSASDKQCDQSAKYHGSSGFGCSKPGENGTDYRANIPEQAVPIGLDLLGLNLDKIARDADPLHTSSCSASPPAAGSSGYSDPVSYYNNCPWAIRVLVALCVSSLLIYIMLSLLTYIPTLATNLAGSFGQDLIGYGKNVIGSAMGGKGFLGSAQNAATSGAQRFENGGAREVITGGAGRAGDSTLAGDR